MQPPSPQMTTTVPAGQAHGRRSRRRRTWPSRVSVYSAASVPRWPPAPADRPRGRPTGPPVRIAPGSTSTSASSSWPSDRRRRRVPPIGSEPSRRRSRGGSTAGTRRPGAARTALGPRTGQSRQRDQGEGGGEHRPYDRPLGRTIGAQDTPLDGPCRGHVPVSRGVRISGRRRCPGRARDLGRADVPPTHAATWIWLPSPSCPAGRPRPAGPRRSRTRPGPARSVGAPSSSASSPVSGSTRNRLSRPMSVSSGSATQTATHSPVSSQRTSKSASRALDERLESAGHRRAGGQADQGGSGPRPGATCAPRHRRPTVPTQATARAPDRVDWPGATASPRGPSRSPLAGSMVTDRRPSASRRRSGVGAAG